MVNKSSYLNVVRLIKTSAQARAIINWLIDGMHHSANEWLGPLLFEPSRWRNVIRRDLNTIRFVSVLVSFINDMEFPIDSKFLYWIMFRPVVVSKMPVRVLCCSIFV